MSEQAKLYAVSHLHLKLSQVACAGYGCQIWAKLTFENSFSRKRRFKPDLNIYDCAITIRERFDNEYCAKGTFVELLSVILSNGLIKPI